MATEGYHMNKELGLTFTQATVLFMLKKKGELNVTELADILGVSKSAATQLIDGLAKHEFLTRESDEIDRRVFKIKLSLKGLKYMESLRKKVFCKFSFVFESLTKDELNQLVKITNKLIKKNEKNKE